MIEIRHIDAPPVEAVDGCTALGTADEQWRCIVGAIAAPEIAVCTDVTPLKTTPPAQSTNSTSVLVG